MRLRLLPRLAPAVLAVTALVAGGGAARAQTPTTPLPPPPTPKAYILVDGESGGVLAEHNARTPLLAASTIKLLTAITVVERLDPHEMVPISERAAGMPARKINVKAGQSWRADHLLHSLLLVSANDAAVAVAEAIGGSLEGYVEVLERTARRLGMEDSPVLRDPSGLDDQFSHEGGNRISARDLAIAARTALAYPEIAEIVGLSEYRFEGGDGHWHRLRNHNKLLTSYSGAVGMKTGATKRAGRSLVGAATRDGRTMVAVVLGAVDTYRSAALLLDKGFATPVAPDPGRDYLPEVVNYPEQEPTAAARELDAVADEVAQGESAALPGAGGTDAPAWEGWLASDSPRVAAIGGLPAVAILLRRRHRRRRAERIARASLGM